MLTVQCRECGTQYRLKSRPTKRVLRCRFCGSGIRIGNRRKVASANRISDVIVRVVGGITFVGTLINFIYGIATIDGSSKHSQRQPGQIDPFVLHILPFFVVGLLGAYAAWHGAPRFEGIARRARTEGLVDIAMGLGMLVLGAGVSFLISYFASPFGIIVAASGLFIGGAGLCFKGCLVIITGRDV